MTDLLMTPAEAATYLRLSKSTLDKLRPVEALFTQSLVAVSSTTVKTS